jgi:hypothetical protein
MAVFHEARLPLNTALLPYELLQQEGVFAGLNMDQAELAYGLSASLTMMEKVSVASPLQLS